MVPKFNLDRMSPLIRLTERASIVYLKSKCVVCFSKNFFFSRNSNVIYKNIVFKSWLYLRKSVFTLRTTISAYVGRFLDTVVLYF